MNSKSERIKKDLDILYQEYYNKVFEYVKKNNLICCDIGHYRRYSYEEIAKCIAQHYTLFVSSCLPNLCDSEEDLKQKLLDEVQWNIKDSNNQLKNISKDITCCKKEIKSIEKKLNELEVIKEEIQSNKRIASL